MRIEPPPSLPCASGTMPAATAAAAPPEEPPGVRSVSHGLRVGPKRRGSVTGRIPNSGMLVLPTITKPASRRRRTTKASWAGDEVAEQVGAQRVRHARHGGGVLDRDRDAGEGPLVAGPIASAAARAPSGSVWTNALSSRLSASMRSSDASTSSRALTLAAANERGELGGRPVEQIGTPRRRGYRPGANPGVGRFISEMDTESDQPGLDGRLAELVRRQYGVVTRQQLRRLGSGSTVSRSGCGAGRLHRLHRGVYVVGHQALAHKAHWMAAVLACGRRGGAVHAAAAALRGIRPSAATWST